MLPVTIFDALVEGIIGLLLPCPCPRRHRHVCFPRPRNQALLILSDTIPKAWKEIIALVDSMALILELCRLL